MAAVKTIYRKVNFTKNYVFILFIVALLLALTLLGVVFIKSEDQLDYIYTPHMVKESAIKHVMLTGSDGSTELVDLPVVRDSKYSYTFSFEVDNDVNDMQQYVNVITHYTSFVLKHKGEVIFQAMPQKNAIVKSMALSYNTIKIPKRLLGKRLDIEFSSNVPENKKFQIPQLLVGTESQLRKHYFYKDLFKILAAVALFITAIFISVIGFFFIKIGQVARNLFIAVLFAGIMALYVFFGTQLMLYFFQNSVLPYFAVYACLMLMPTPIYLLFLNILYENDYCDWRVMSFEFIVVVQLINFIIQWVLTLLGISEFVLMENITIALLVGSLFYNFIVVLSLDKNRIGDKLILVLSVMPLSTTMTISAWNYYQFKTPPIVLTIFCAIFFLIIHFQLSLKKYIYEYNLAIEDDFYRQLAYHDSLTQLPNRHNFERDIQQIASNSIRFSSVYLMMIDMNNLKEINDNYGHNMGDAYLKAAGELFLKLEKKYSEIKTYRQGGDEFIILAYNKEESELRRIINDIKKMSNKITIKKCDYVLDFAIGYAKCDDQRIFDAYRIKDEADKRMYLSKKHKMEVILNE